MLRAFLHDDILLYDFSWFSPFSTKNAKCRGLKFSLGKEHITTIMLEIVIDQYVGYGYTSNNFVIRRDRYPVQCSLFKLVMSMTN